MGEIVGIHIGQCGVNIGCQYWSQLMSEYCVSADTRTCSGKYPPAVQFHETAEGLVPRGLFFDTDSTSLDSVCGSGLGRSLPLEHFVGGSSGSNNNYVSGRYTLGAEMAESLEDSIRKECEKCERFAGFQLSSSICGGTGSGLLSRLLILLRSQYSTCHINCYAVFPSPDKSETILEGYNSILTMPQLSEEVDGAMVLDNQAINKAYERLAGEAPTGANLNRLVASAMCGVTACHRFPSAMCCSLRKMAVWLVPYPILNWSSLAALPPVPADPPMSAENLVSQVFDPRSQMCSADLRRGVSISAVASSRGKVSAKELEEEFAKRGDQWSPYFVSYSMGGVKGLVCNVQSPGKALDCTLITNNSSVASVFETVLCRFKKLYQRRAFTHQYLKEGMEQTEFASAEYSTTELISAYKELAVDARISEDE